MQDNLKTENKSQQFSMKKLQFSVMKNTVLRAMPDNMKEHVEHAFLNGHKTKELKFLHSRIDGFLLPALMSEKDVNLCSKFQGRPGDVFLITYPKSATTWLSAIVRSIAKPNDFFEGPLMGETGPLFEVADHKKLEAAPSPRYLVTHLQPTLMPYSSENGVQYIYLARNPRDVVVSYYHFMRQTKIFNFDGNWDEFVGYFMKGDLPYGSYFDHVLQWWSRKDNDNVLFLKYEDLKKDLKSQVKVIAEFIGFNFSDEQSEAVAEQCTFQAMKSKYNQSLPSHGLSKMFKTDSHLRKGIVGDWKNHFSDEQLEEFNQLYKSRMDGSGLEFEFEAR